MAKNVRIWVERGGKKVPLVIGTVEGDTFTATERDVYEHLFRAGADSALEAMVEGVGAWGLDLAAMEGLRDMGVRFVVIPTKQGVSYKTKMETLLGPKSFTKHFSGHRPQVFLNLQYWVEGRL